MYNPLCTKKERPLPFRAERRSKTFGIRIRQIQRLLSVPHGGPDKRTRRR